MVFHDAKDPINDDATSIQILKQVTGQKFIVKTSSETFNRPPQYILSKQSLPYSKACNHEGLPHELLAKKKFTKVIDMLVYQTAVTKPLHN